ncbi:unnamed protein product [Adineta ricciae]|uniref:Apple domain-containing protein n=1 Tax=Adineta ricciae TaxID=249248 RepID=A0A813UUH3_ADIRI|nr:unnamed protein product [Adineta ricciae]
MSVSIGRRFQCANTSCLPFRTSIVSEVLNCQTNCLTETYCKAASFSTITFGCDLFDNILDHKADLLADVNTISMIVVGGTRIPSAIEVTEISITPSSSMSLTSKLITSSTSSSLISTLITSSRFSTSTSDSTTVTSSSSSTSSATTLTSSSTSTTTTSSSSSTITSGSTSSTSMTSSSSSTSTSETTTSTATTSSSSSTSTSETTTSAATTSSSSSTSTSQTTTSATTATTTTTSSSTSETTTSATTTSQTTTSATTATTTTSSSSTSTSATSTTSTTTTTASRKSLSTMRDISAHMFPVFSSNELHELYLLACPWGGIPLTFDNIPNADAVQGALPSNYSGLSWTNGKYLNATAFSTTGCIYALVSGQYVTFLKSTVIIQTLPNNATITLNSGQFSSAYANGNRLMMTGYDGSSALYNVTLALNVYSRYSGVFNWTGVNKIVLQPTGTGYWDTCIDNLCITF